MSAVRLRVRRATLRGGELSRYRLRARRSRVGAGASTHRRPSRRRGARQHVPPLLRRRGSIAEPAPVSRFAQRAQAGYLSRSRAGCPRPSAAFAHSLLAVPVYGAGDPPAARRAPAPPLRISLLAARRLFDFAPATVAPTHALYPPMASAAASRHTPCLPARLAPVTSRQGSRPRDTIPVPTCGSPVPAHGSRSRTEKE